MRKTKVPAFLLTFAFFAAIPGAAAAHDGAAAGRRKPVQAAAPCESAPKMYAWEQERNGLLSFTDLVLCYGGSTHRKPFRWDKQRFAPLVTYTDEQNTEHWLFDAFLCIEFRTLTRSYNLGQMLPSADKKQWQELIDYWFDSDNGVNALEEAVEEASERLGAPPSKRKVVMVLPDAIIYKMYNDPESPTDYWGSLDGRRLDFASGDDRMAASKWFIDEVRRRFDAAGYRQIELAGFYVVSEDLVTPTSGGWNHELKRSEEVVPHVSAYLHALNECLCWIPYNRASGYKIWSDLGFDYAYMQPNHYWDDKGERPLARFFSDIKSADLAMEFEFEETILEGKPDCDVYKKRFRDYMSGAKANGVYGKKPLSYYHGTNGIYELWKSTDPKDRALYHEFCRFVIGNPLRK